MHQVQMEGVVRGIQADMTRLSKSHSHTSNTVSKLLDKSRKLSVTMKEVSECTDTPGAPGGLFSMSSMFSMSSTSSMSCLCRSETGWSVRAPR